MAEKLTAIQPPMEVFSFKGTQGLVTMITSTCSCHVSDELGTYEGNGCKAPLVHNFGT